MNTKKDAPRWVTLPVAAMILRKTTQATNSLGLEGQILRKQRKITYHAVKPCWMYSIDSLLEYRKRYGKPNQGAEPRWTFDVSRTYIRAQDAAAILLCSTNAVYALGRAGEIKTQKTVFLYPVNRAQIGFSFGDVMALKVAQGRAPRATAFEEETAVEQTTLTREVDEKTAGLDAAMRKALIAHANRLLELANAR